MVTATASITSLCAEASAAIAAGDFPTAQSKLLQAQAYLPGLPNRTNEGDGIQWNNSRITIDSLLDNLRKARNAARGICRSSVTYVRG